MKPNQTSLQFVVAALMACVSSLAAFDASGDTLPSVTKDAQGPATAALETPHGPVTAPAERYGSGVVLRYLVPSAIKVGQSITVTLYFSNVTADDGAHVVVRTLDPHKQLATFYVQKGEERTLDLPMLLTTDGTRYLAVATTQAGRTSVQAVPLRVGSGRVTLKSEGKRRVTPTGENVISLPSSQ